MEVGGTDDSRDENYVGAHRLLDCSDGGELCGMVMAR
jgi:hypothetical protein